MTASRKQRSFEGTAGITGEQWRPIGSPVRTRSTGRTLAILAFHKIGEPPPGSWKTWFYIPEETFAAHLSYLYENGWQVMDVMAFLRGLAAPESLPERAALLTFDDGYRSMLHGALPWMVRFRFPAVLFMPTDFIGEYNRFDAECEPREVICGWDDLRELQRWGVSVQSHGASHRRLSGLDAVEQEQELLRSKATLEAELESPVEVFAYPYGDCGDSSQALAKALKGAGYRAACLYGGGPNHVPIADPYRLTRLAMGPDTDLHGALGER